VHAAVAGSAAVAKAPAAAPAQTRTHTHPHTHQRTPGMRYVCWRWHTPLVYTGGRLLRVVLTAATATAQLLVSACPCPPCCVLSSARGTRCGACLLPHAVPPAATLLPTTPLACRCRLCAAVGCSGAHRLVMSCVCQCHVIAPCVTPCCGHSCYNSPRVHAVHQQFARVRGAVCGAGDAQQRVRTRMSTPGWRGWVRRAMRIGWRWRRGRWRVGSLDDVTACRHRIGP